MYERGSGYTTYMANKQEKPVARKTMVLLTDSEWRALRIAAAMRDTSVQGYLTTLALGALQGKDRAALDAAQVSKRTTRSGTTARNPGA